MTVGSWGDAIRLDDDPIPTPAPPPRELENDAAYWWGRLREAEAAIQAWELVKQEMRGHLIDWLGEATTGTIGGHPVVRYTSYKTMQLDQAILRERFPEAYSLCRTEVTRRRFVTSETEASE